MLLLLFAAAGNVSAHPGHASCREFGLGVASLAQTGLLGGITSTLATSGPTAVSNDSASGHGFHCEPK